MIALLLAGLLGVHPVLQLTPTITFVDENTCLRNIGCGNYLWQQIGTGGPNPSVVRLCNDPIQYVSDPAACVGELMQTVTPYRVCLWSIQPGDLPQYRGLDACPAVDEPTLARIEPGASQSSWCGSGGCRPPGLIPIIWELRGYR